jgi:hypothetical protein
MAESSKHASRRRRSCANHRAIGGLRWKVRKKSAHLKVRNDIILHSYGAAAASPTIGLKRYCTVIPAGHVRLVHDC